MAAGPPLTKLAMSATSVADDLGYVALADLSSALGGSADTNYRVIGGHMVTAHAARWDLGDELYRETADVDLGVPPVVVRDGQLVERLTSLGYDKVAGNRFARTMADVPVDAGEDREASHRAIIDVLVPAYTSRTRSNRRVTEQLVTTEVPGLASALTRSPVTVSLELRRLNGDVFSVDVSFPDEVSALVLKATATRVRTKPTDVIDMWRCLEVAFAAGVPPTEFGSGEPAEAAAIVRELFGKRDGPGMTTIATEQRLSPPAADERFTRIRALTVRVFGES